jgi:hypothetical protein
MNLPSPARALRITRSIYRCKLCGFARPVMSAPSDPGPPPWVRPAARWFVPKGFVIAQGAAEINACRALILRGLLRPSHIPRSPELPYGQGGYAITKKGRMALGR